MKDLLWTFPVLMAASVVIGWAAEVMAAFLSAGIALAVLAWLQTAPEFAVEATIAWHRDSHLALANLTGSLRLLMGFGWPMIFLIHWVSSKKRHGAGLRSITLPASFSVEAAGLALPVLYFLFVYVKGRWSALDGVILCSFYGLYFWMLNRQRNSQRGTEDHLRDEDEPWIVRKALRQPRPIRYLATFAMFLVGGGALLFTVHPFLDALKSSAASLGVSDFIFVQWIAPIASEMPEKVTAFGWALRPKKVPMALVNMLSSVTSQWTLLAGLVPLVFSLSAGHPFTIELTHFQRTELVLTIVQSALVVVFLADLKIEAYEAIGLFALWLVQFVMPSAREQLIPLYFLWIVIESLRLALNPARMTAWKTLKKLMFSSSAARSR